MRNRKLLYTCFSRFIYEKKKEKSRILHASRRRVHDCAAVLRPKRLRLERNNFVAFINYARVVVLVFNDMPYINTCVRKVVISTGFSDYKRAYVRIIITRNNRARGIKKIKPSVLCCYAEVFAPFKRVIVGIYVRPSLLSRGYVVLVHRTGFSHRTRAYFLQFFIIIIHRSFSDDLKLKIGCIDKFTSIGFISVREHNASFFLFFLYLNRSSSIL